MVYYISVSGPAARNTLCSRRAARPCAAENAMRVLVVSQHYWPENFRITDICEGMVENGTEVDVLCGLPNYPAGEWFPGYGYWKKRRESHGGVQLFRAGEIRRKGNTSLRIFLNYVSFPLAASCNLFRLIGRRYDAVFCYETSPVLMMLPAILYAKLARKPLTTYVLDLWPENLYSVLPVASPALRAVAKGVSHWFYRRSTRLVAMSPPLAEKLREIAPRREVLTIPQYCEDFYDQDAQAPALQQRYTGRFCLVFAGNFSPAQNLELLVECARGLRDIGRQDIHFVLVGDGMSHAALKNQVESEGLDGWFSFEGRMPPEKIPPYHSLAGCLFAALAKSDDLGLTVPAKIASYMAAGRPLLTAIDGEAARVVLEAACGFASEAGNAPALLENLLRLADMDEAQRQAMGENARLYYRAHFRRAELLAQLSGAILRP